MEKSSIENQVGPCGITCGTCFLGNGTMAKTMGEASHYINMSGIKEWSPQVPGGTDINWDETEKALDWMQKYAYCAGCEAGGGPPDCAIRVCASERGYELCSQCNDLDTLGSRVSPLVVLTGQIFYGNDGFIFPYRNFFIVYDVHWWF